MQSAELVLFEAPGATICQQSRELVDSYLENARPRNTIRSYRSSFRQFEKWCQAANLTSMPAAPETIALYVGARGGQLKAGTLAHALAAISKAHKSAGYSSPVPDNQLISETLKGVKRVHGAAVTQKAAVLTDDLRLMLRFVPDKLIGIRDRALLLVGFAGAFRRSELVGLNLEDLKFTAEGLLITLRRSKTDQEGQGRDVAIPHGAHEATCPVRAMQAWLLAGIITEGPIFRSITRHSRLSNARLSDHAVALVVKRYAKLAGLQASSFSGRSLRRLCYELRQGRGVGTENHADHWPQNMRWFFGTCGRRMCLLTMQR